MTKKTYWKEVWKSIGSSKGRFLSISLLMMLGAFAFVGLKVTTPDMQTSGAAYLKEQKAMDITVVGTMGLGEKDQAELNAIKQAQVAFGSMTDVTLANTDDAIRVFSLPKAISAVKLIEGELPKTAHDIVLASPLSKRYKIGDTIEFVQSAENKPLKTETFTVTGFVTSPEIWSKTNLGSSTAGDGNLTAYAYVIPDVFEEKTPSLARIRYDDLAHLSPFSKAYKEKLRDKQKQLEKALSDNADQRLAELKQAPQTEIEKGKAKLLATQEKLQANERALAAAKESLEQQEAGFAGLPAEQAQAAKQALLGAKDQLRQQESQLQAAQKALDEQAAQLKRAQEDLSALKAPSYHTYTKETLPGGNGYMVYASGSDSVAEIGNIFPVVLYLVAALVVFTTMTRFVDEERQQAAILKALGYSNRDVILKFVLYGLMAGLTGTVLGVIGGHYLLAPVIADIMTRDLTIPPTQYQFYWKESVIALGLALVSAVLPAYLIARRELSQKAAQLLLPKPPVKGSSILLERVSVIWKRISFTHKVTARNIFRYKKRMLMTIFGVAGSVALLFAGLGIQSSLAQVVGNQFERLMPYDMMIVENTDASARAKEQLRKALASNQINKHEKRTFAQLTVTVPKMTQQQQVSLLAVPTADFDGFIHLYDTQTHKPIKLPKDGVLMSQKLAQSYGVEKGQTLTMTDTTGHAFKVKVAGIIEMNVGHYLMMRDEVLEQTFGEIQSSPAYLVTLKNRSKKALRHQAADFLRLSAVSGLSQNSAVVDTVDAVVASLTGAMTILTFVAILLAVVILYNLTTINVSERIRELSTIKVLGFYNKEVTLYIYRETILLSVIGIVTGLVSGIFLHRVIMGMIGSSDILFGTGVDWLVYAAPITVVVLILFILGYLVNRRLSKLDMLEALKSVD